MLDADEFRNCVRMYVELNDEISTSSKHLSELRKKKEAIGELILGFMKHNNIDACELQTGGKLVRKESKRTAPLNKEHILAELLHLVGQDSTRAQTCLQNIYDKRGVTVTETLTRTKR